ncbi:hypothetical protein I541_5714, partial [Mycobacteroides abscessus]
MNCLPVMAGARRDVEDLANNCGMLPEIGECLAEIPD